MKSTRNFLKLSLAAPLALALAACGGGTDEIEEGDVIAAIPAPDGTNWGETVTVSEEDGYVLGNPDAPIKLVEYGSLTCPACAAFSAEASEPLLNDYVNSGRVSFEFRSFMIHGIADLVLTRMLECGAPTAAVSTSAPQRVPRFAGTTAPTSAQAISLSALAWEADR